MIYYPLSALINAIASTLVFVIVLIKNPRSHVNRAFSYFAFSVAFWSYCYFLWQISKNTDNALFRCRILMAGAIFIPSTFLHFSISLTGQFKRYFKTIFFWYIVSVYFLILDFTPFFVKDVKPRLYFQYWPSAGIAYAPFLAIFIFLTIYSHVLMYKSFKDLSDAKRNQIKYVFLGTAIGFLGGSTNYPLWYNIPIPPIGNALVAVYVILVAYAIVKYRLMDITIAITSAGIFAFVYFFVLWLPFWIGYQTKSWFITAIFMFILATLGPSLYTYLRRQAENRLLAEDKKAQELLAKASNGMTTIRELKKLLGLITHLITKLMKVKNAGIYLLDEATGAYILQSIRHQNINPEPLNKEDNKLIQWLIKTKSPLVHDEVKMQLQQEADEELSSVVEEMRKLDAAVIIPSFIEDLLLGFLILGQRKDNRVYTQENLNVLEVLANQAALAIENAIFYEETGKTLAERFHESRLRSIGTLGAGIGHQINNRFNAIAVPAQVISMKIEKKDLDKLPQDDLKRLVIESKKALDSITNDALRGGKIATSLTSFSRKTEGYQAVPFAKVIDEVLNLLSCKFRLEELNLKQDISSDGSRLWGNPSQLDDVFFNLLDNAHDATKKKPLSAKEGAITIEPNYQPKVLLHTTRADNKRLKITLEDNGIGMTEEQIGKLFIPFFTTKATAGKGTGLGLWIIKQIIEAHRGTIEVESTYGRGTKFTITLPLATKEQIESSANSDSIRETPKHET